MKKWVSKLTPGQNVMLVVGFISAFAIIIAAILQRPTDTEAVQMVINATQTAEIRLTEMALSATLPPTNTPQPTFTPSQTPTYTATPTATATASYLFSDNFENGLSQWEIEIPDIWKIEQDVNNNSILCVTSGSNYAYALAGSQTWENYALVFDMLIDKSYPSSVPLFSVRFGEGRKYEVIVSKGQSDIYKSIFSPQFDTIWLNKSERPSFIDNQWHSFQFSVNQGELSVLSDSDFAIKYSDTDYFKSGKIALGASPDTRVCFDNVHVMSFP